MDKYTIDEIKAMIKDLELILGIIPSYSLGRYRGYPDEETEIRVNNVVDNLYEMLVNIEKLKR